jgi:hypothetical protein
VVEEGLGLPDKMHKSEKEYEDHKCNIEGSCKDDEELILALARELLKHEDVAKFAISHYDQFADRSDCTRHALWSIICSR